MGLNLDYWQQRCCLSPHYFSQNQDLCKQTHCILPEKLKQGNTVEPHSSKASWRITGLTCWWQHPYFICVLSAETFRFCTSCGHSSLHLAVPSLSFFFSPAVTWYWFCFYWGVKKMIMKLKQIILRQEWLKLVHCQINLHFKNNLSVICENLMILGLYNFWTGVFWICDS